MSLLLLAFISGCDMDINSKKLSAIQSVRDIEDIKRIGVLTTVTDFNSTNYFIYKGEPMGYQFDMLQAFAQHIGVKLELIAENNLDEAFQMLENGEVDIFANNLTVTTKRKEKFLFTLPHSTTRQVLDRKSVV